MSLVVVILLTKKEKRVRENVRQYHSIIVSLFFGRRFHALMISNRNCELREELGTWYESLKGFGFSRRFHFACYWLPVPISCVSWDRLTWLQAKGKACGRRLQKRRRKNSQFVDPNFPQTFWSSTFELSFRHPSLWIESGVLLHPLGLKTHTQSTFSKNWSKIFLLFSRSFFSVK